MSVIKKVWGPKAPAGSIEWLDNQRTPLDVVGARGGRSGQVWYYVSHHYVSEVMNRLTQYRWHSLLMAESMHQGEMVAHVRVTAWIVDPEGVPFEVSHDAAGSSPVLYKDNGQPLPQAPADALNSAISRAVVKACSRMGIGADLHQKITTPTLRRLHAVGTEVCGGDKDTWDAFRPSLVRLLTPGQTKGSNRKPLTSASDLSEVQARLATAALDRKDPDNGLPIVQDIAEMLRPVLLGLLNQ